MVLNAVYPSRDAEQVLFREEFANPATVHANGGQLFGGAVPNNGLPCDGSTQYALWTYVPDVFALPEISIVCEFNPSFTVSEDVEACLFASSETQFGASNQTLVFKRNNASSNVLLIQIGGTVIATILEGVYGSYWNVGKRNRLVVSAKSGATDVWLNGTQILTADASAWSPAYAPFLHVGSNRSALNKFSGVIYSLDVRRGLLTQADVDAIESGSLFNYMNRANLVLDMAEATQRPDLTNEQITDGDMSVPASWTLQEGSTITGGKMVVDGSQTATKYNTQAASIVAGRIYRVRFTISDYVAGTVTPYAGSTGAGTGVTADGEYEQFIVAAGNASFYFIYNATFEGKIDDASVMLMTHQTLDRSPNGHVCLLGDGSTAATIPTFENPGFDLDGTSDYLYIPNASGIYNNAGQTLVQFFRPHFAPGDGVLHYLLDSTNGARYSVYKSIANELALLLNGTGVFTLAAALYQDYWNTNGKNVLIIAAESADTDAYLNGHQIVTADSTAWTPGDPSEIYLGSRFSVSNWFDGEYLGVHSYPFKLSPLQARSLTLEMGVVPNV